MNESRLSTFVSVHHVGIITIITNNRFINKLRFSIAFVVMFGDIILLTDMWH